MISQNIFLYKTVQFEHIAYTIYISTPYISESQTTDILKQIFWDQKIHFKTPVVWNEG